VDIMPYLEYISKRDSSKNIDDIKTGSLEMEIIEYINKSLFSM
jgi:hypothetical protein